MAPAIPPEPLSLKTTLVLAAGASRKDPRDAGEVDAYRDAHRTAHPSRQRSALRAPRRRAHRAREARPPEGAAPPPLEPPPRAVRGGRVHVLPVPADDGDVRRDPRLHRGRRDRQVEGAG